MKEEQMENVTICLGVPDIGVNTWFVLSLLLCFGLYYSGLLSYIDLEVRWDGTILWECSALGGRSYISKLYYGMLCG